MINQSKKTKILSKKYISLMEKASLNIGRKEAVSLLHKAEKLRIKISNAKISKSNNNIN